MLKNLQSIFKNTWGAFRSELGRREPEDEVAELLGLMRREMVAARTALPEYEVAVRQAAAELETERRALVDCRRRRVLAGRIGDAETMRVADEFAARHAERAGVLEHKREAARAEWKLRGREVEEMSRRYKEADANRFALLSQLRALRAKERMNGALDDTAGPFDDFARMENAAHDQAAYADALEEMADSDEAAKGTVDVEERLRELKRRMGQG